MIIGVLGHKLSGKGTTAAYLARQYGAQHIIMSSIIVQMLDVLGFAGARSHMAAVITALRETMGMDVLARAAYARVQPGSPFVIVDGIRYAEEIAFFRRQDKVMLVYIDASPEVRWLRSRARGEKTGEKEMTFNQFMVEQLRLNTEQQIEALGAQADVRIVNDSNNVSTLYTALDQALARHICAPGTV